MVFHENCQADNSHEISYLIFFLKIGEDVAKFVGCCSRDWLFKAKHENNGLLNDLEKSIFAVPTPFCSVSCFVIVVCLFNYKLYIF